MKKVIAGGLSAVVAISIAAGCSSQPSDTSSSNSTQANAASATKPVEKPATPAPAPKAKQWTKIMDISGDQNNSPSDRFQLTGGDVKVVWKIKPDNKLANDMVVMSGFLEDASSNTPVDQFEGSLGQKSGEWKVYGVPAGTYYFKPNSANGHWTATIYEMK